MTPCHLLNNSYGEFATSFFCFHITQKHDAPLANEVRVVCRPDVMHTISARGEINKTTAQRYKYFANFPKLCGSLQVMTQTARASATRHTTKKASYKEIIAGFISTI